MKKNCTSVYKKKEGKQAQIEESGKEKEQQERNDTV